MNMSFKNKNDDRTFVKKSASEKMFLIPVFLRILNGQLHYVCYIVSFLFFLGLLYVYIKTRYAHLYPTLIHYLYPAVFAFLMVVSLTPIVLKISKKLKLIERAEPIVSGKVLVPRLGGAGIYVTFLTVMLFYQPWTPEIRSIVFGGGILWLVGTIDDIRSLSSTIRLFMQFLVSLGVVFSGLTVSFMPHTFWGDALAAGITILWIIGIINATNFIDGIDGLATGQAIIAAGFFFLIALHLDQYPIALLASVLMGCGFGFLVFNFKPAKIILGDGGSTLLGFLLACIALYGGWSDWGPIIALGIPVLILGVLIFDVIYITISRIKNGQVRTFKEWLDYHGRDHFHHRLLNIGFKEHEAVLFIYMISIVLGLSALVIEHARVSFPVVVLLIQATLIFLIISILMLVGREFEETDEKKRHNC